MPSTGPLFTYLEPKASATPLSPGCIADGGDGVAGKSGGSAGGGSSNINSSVINSSGVRVDAGVVEGSTVSMFYDPMISKVVTYGDTRQEALRRLSTALDGEVVICARNGLISILFVSWFVSLLIH